MEQKKCRNKKCQRPLPAGYKHKYCENCRNEHVKNLKEYGVGLLSVGMLVGGTAIVVVTKGKINPLDK